jgi:hypothetical protein
MTLYSKRPERVEAFKFDGKAESIGEICLRVGLIKPGVYAYAVRKVDGLGCSRLVLYIRFGLFRTYTVDIGYYVVIYDNRTIGIIYEEDFDMQYRVVQERPTNEHQKQ